MKNHQDKTQFTDADFGVSYVPDYGTSETLVEYSDLEPTYPVSGSDGGAPAQGEYEDQPTEVDESDVTVVEDSIDISASAGGASKIRPAVGWLVSVKGPCKGIDYRLHANYNKIGRNSALDVSVEDPKFSKSPVAWVGYFQETNAYFVGAESSTNVLYVNNVPLPAGQSRELAYGDRLRMGDTELLFIPLCGDHFRWTQDRKEE